MRTITRATSRPGLASALIVAAALASCGGSADKPASTAATSVATTAKAPPAPAAPDGHLSPAEYDSMRGLVEEIGKLERIKDTKAGLHAVRSACRGFASAPRTELMVANQSVCAQLVRLIRVVSRFDTQQKECQQAAQAGDLSCFAQLYRSLAGAARVIAVRAEAANAAGRKRHLASACARAVNTKPGEIDNYRSLTRDSRAAALALEAKDQARLQRALAAIKHDFDYDNGESTAKTLRQLRACKA